jgi:hypothetical protein
MKGPGLFLRQRRQVARRVGHHHQQRFGAGRATGHQFPVLAWQGHTLAAAHAVVGGQFIGVQQVQAAAVAAGLGDVEVTVALRRDVDFQHVHADLQLLLAAGGHDPAFAVALAMQFLQDLRRRGGALGRGSRCRGRSAWHSHRGGGCGGGGAGSRCGGCGGSVAVLAAGLAAGATKAAPIQAGTKLRLPATVICWPRMPGCPASPVLTLACAQRSLLRP